MITNEEYDIIYNVKQSFWLKFSDLVKETLLEIQPHLRDELLSQMGDMTSVYGIKR